MHRAFAGSRLALILRRLRGRFGIAAPRVAIRTHVPWYWRALLATLVLAAGLALAGWIYDTGRRFAGFDKRLSESEILSLREKAAQLEEEVARLRALANAAESAQRIDKASIEQLTAQVKTLSEENAQLKENLAVYESLAGARHGNEGLQLTNLRIEPDGRPGRYRYRMLASWRDADPKKEFSGSLQFVVTVLKPDGRSAMMFVPRPEEGEREKSRFAVSFRNLRRLDGAFEIPADTKPSRVEARLIQEGAVKASTAIAL